MGDMSPKQLRFIAEYTKSGNATESARRAGYKQPHVAGPRMLGNVRIREKLVEADQDFQAMFAGEVAHSIQTIVRLRDTAENESVRLRAAQDLLDRAGLKPKEKVDMDLSGEVNTKHEQQYTVTHTIEEYATSFANVLARKDRALSGDTQSDGAGQSIHPAEADIETS